MEGLHGIILMLCKIQLYFTDTWSITYQSCPSYSGQIFSLKVFIPVGAGQRWQSPEHYFCHWMKSLKAVVLM